MHKGLLRLQEIVFMLDHLQCFPLSLQQGKITHCVCYRGGCGFCKPRCGSVGVVYLEHLGGCLLFPAHSRVLLHTHLHGHVAGLVCSCGRSKGHVTSKDDGVCTHSYRIQVAASIYVPGQTH